MSAPLPPSTPFPEALRSDYQRFMDEIRALFFALMKHFHAPLMVYAPADTPSIQPQARLAEIIDLRVACEKQIAHMDVVLVELMANCAAREAAQPPAETLAEPVPPVQQASQVQPVTRSKKKKKAA